MVEDMDSWEYQESSMRSDPLYLDAYAWLKGQHLADPSGFSFTQKFFKF